MKYGYGNDEKEKKLLERTKGEKIIGQANYTLVLLYIWSIYERNREQDLRIRAIAVVCYHNQWLRFISNFDR